MTLTNLTCPECQATLRPKQPVPVGARVKCPGCGELFTALAPARAAVAGKKPPQAEEEDIPEVLPDDEADEEEEKDRPARKPQRRSAARDDEEDEDDRGPRRKREPARKKKRGSSALVWLLVGGGVAAILIAGVVVGLLFFMPRANSPGGILGLGGAKPGVTEENFKRLAYGMSEADANGILGQPAEAADVGQVAPGVKMRHVVWKGPNILIQMDFFNGQINNGSCHVNGRVTAQITKPAGPKPPDDKPKGPFVTKGNYEKITDGMTQAEVVLILGTPTQKLGPQQIFAGFNSDDTWKWGEGRSYILVHFRGGVYGGKEAHNVQ